MFDMFQIPRINWLHKIIKDQELHLEDGHISGRNVLMTLIQ